MFPQSLCQYWHPYKMTLLRPCQHCHVIDRCQVCLRSVVKQVFIFISVLVTEGKDLNKETLLYTTSSKVCGHPFKFVDWAISATSIADRCIKSSTGPCNLHRQTLVVEWPYWRALWLSMSHSHRMPYFQPVSFSNVCPARASPVNCMCCYCEVETSRSNNGSQNGTVECWSV
jgi:hypothetical protein